MILVSIQLCSNCFCATTDKPNPKDNQFYDNKRQLKSRTEDILGKMTHFSELMQINLLIC